MVSVAVFVTRPSAAVIVTAPPLTAVARPFVEPVLLMVATELSGDVQTTDAVISWVVPLLKLPVATNCWVVPIAILAVAGNIVMEVSVAEVTVSVDEPEMPPNHAVMVVVPTETGVANPALLIAATSAFEEIQVACCVRSSKEPSEYMPVAENCSVSLSGTLESGDVTWIDSSVAEVTVRSVLPDTPASDAVIVVRPAPTEVASPLESGALLIVATVVDKELQTTDAVRSSVVLSE